MTTWLRVSVRALLAAAVVGVAVASFMASLVTQHAPDAMTPTWVELSTIAVLWWLLGTGLALGLYVGARLLLTLISRPDDRKEERR